VRVRVGENVVGWKEHIPRKRTIALGGKKKGRLALDEGISAKIKIYVLSPVRKIHASKYIVRGKKEVVYPTGKGGARPLSLRKGSDKGSII